MHLSKIPSFHQFLRQDQVNLLVYGPDRPYFKQKQKKNSITKFWPTGFFLIYYFLLFEKKERKKEIKQQTYINNQNQEAFIVITTNYKLQVFLLCLLCKILFFEKYRP